MLIKFVQFIAFKYDVDYFHCSQFFYLLLPQLSFTFINPYIDAFSTIFAEFLVRYRDMGGQTVHNLSYSWVMFKLRKLLIL